MAITLIFILSDGNKKGEFFNLLFLKSNYLSQNRVWYKLGCLWQRLLSSPLERGAGGVFRKTYTPLYPLFLEGNHERLKFLYIELKRHKERQDKYGRCEPGKSKELKIPTSQLLNLLGFLCPLWLVYFPLFCEICGLFY